MHLSEKDCSSYFGPSMDTDEMIALLEHLDQCSYCLEQMIEKEEHSSVKAPDYLKEQIMDKISSPSIQVEKTMNTASYRLQIFYCGLKTAAGVLMALFLLFSISHGLTSAQMTFSAGSIENAIKSESISPGPKHLSQVSRSIGQWLSSGSTAFSRHLSDISNTLINGGN